MTLLPFLWVPNKIAFAQLDVNNLLKPEIKVVFPVPAYPFNTKTASSPESIKYSVTFERKFVVEV